MHFISQRDSQRLKLCLCQYWSFLNKHSLGETFKLRLFKPKGFIFKHFEFFFTFSNIFKHFKQTFARWDFKMRIFKPKGFILPPHIFQNWQLFEYQKRIWIKTWKQIVWAQIVFKRKGFSPPLWLHPLVSFLQGAPPFSLPSDFHINHLQYIYL